ncbi:MAG: Bis(5'-nucleosyl)-tetraphosphatase, symmetrical (EC [uncultured Sulfurovum sp.]|uniref:bis(5'-nucleosyl)-tetraphosphatase (symmetrical) n=1 Tax=uncultured Sulfurovum sp. TaxID=269237 RepID=A0A6S6TX96_9BACT|nr:MAG: Bis(5'-nucleosyl)-tetraphosphatase, symmetrical (EC [uncultured Sulfurovum sp.]
MAVWAIGDIQGCFDSFIELLEKINFNPDEDKLWIAGDLVNRGDKSLETLNYLYSIKNSISIVLGNHDIALIAAYAGVKKANETIQPILDAPNARELIHWLRQQPFFHWDFKLGYCMAHAGISPEFDFGMATNYSLRIEKKLQGRNYRSWLKHMYKVSSNKFSAKASSMDIDKYILSSFIAMRFCEDDGTLDFKQKGVPTEYKVLKKGLKPWFACPTRRSTTLKIVFGHWSTLGYYQDSNVLALDTGCLWGGKLTAARLDTDEAIIVQIPCKAQQNP